jgi:hypothetical protein
VSPYRAAHWTALAAGLLVLAAGTGCTTSATPAVRARIALADDAAAIEVSGLAPRDLGALRGAGWQRETWEQLLRVAVGPEAPAVLGTYAVTRDGIRFTPRFSFDSGRSYHVTFDPSRLPGSTAEHGAATTTIVSRPSASLPPAATVTAVYPLASTLPANLLRIYIQFSAPMGQGGAEHVRILDEQGRALADPFLPLDTELWSRDRTRITLLFDPGRVKRGILPNAQMGRPLQPGRRYTFVVDRTWRDVHGRALYDEYRREFSVGPADESPINPAAWRIESPPSATREPLRVFFPEPLDHGMLRSAMGVSRAGRAIEGVISTEDEERRWLFTPREPWAAGRYAVLVLATLEDLAGNRIGRAFETPGGNPAPAQAESATVAFDVK